MMSASECGRRAFKSGRSKGGCVDFTDSNADKGGRGKKSENFAVIILDGSSLTGHPR